LQKNRERKNHETVEKMKITYKQSLELRLLLDALALSLVNHGHKWEDELKKAFNRGIKILGGEGLEK
jgi:hypothetical protein